MKKRKVCCRQRDSRLTINCNCNNQKVLFLENENFKDIFFKTTFPKLVQVVIQKLFDQLTSCKAFWLYIIVNPLG